MPWPRRREACSCTLSDLEQLLCPAALKTVSEVRVGGGGGGGGGAEGRERERERIMCTSIQYFNQKAKFKNYLLI